MDAFGDRLRYARRRVGRSQADLAAESGVGVATIRRAELGQVAPRPSTVRRLAAALGVRVAWLSVGEGSVTEEVRG